MTNQPSQGTGQASSISWQSRQAAEAWRSMAAVHAGVLGQVTEQMLDLAALDPGMRVLDVAAGAGEQTLAASRRLGSSGRIIAVDISASMLEAANETMREHGADNVETRVMDAQRLELDADSFDAAISRFGVMLVPDPGLALQEIRRVLKPSRRAAVMVWGSAERNPFQSLPFAILRRLGVMPEAPAGPSGPFGLGGPGVLESTFESAGFRDVAVEAAPIQWRFASAADALDYYRLASAPLPPEVAARLGDEGGGVSRPSSSKSFDSSSIRAVSRCPVRR